MNLNQCKYSSPYFTLIGKFWCSLAFFINCKGQSYKKLQTVTSFGFVWVTSAKKGALPPRPFLHRAVFQLPVFICSKTCQNIFIYTSVIVSMAPFQSINRYLFMRIAFYSNKNDRKWRQCFQNRSFPPFYCVFRTEGL